MTIHHVKSFLPGSPAGRKHRKSGTQTAPPDNCRSALRSNQSPGLSAVSRAPRSVQSLSQKKSFPSQSVYGIRRSPAPSPSVQLHLRSPSRLNQVRSPAPAGRSCCFFPKMSVSALSFYCPFAPISIRYHSSGFGRSRYRCSLPFRITRSFPSVTLPITDAGMPCAPR